MSWSAAIRRRIPYVRKRGPAPFVSSQGELRLAGDVCFEAGPIPTHLYVERGAVFEAGSGTVIAFGGAISCHESIRIGDGVRIGPYVQMLDSSFHRPGNFDEPDPPRPVEIGAGAVVGAFSIVLPGARIEPGAVIPPASVVTAPRRSAPS